MQLALFRQFRKPLVVQNSKCRSATTADRNEREGDINSRARRNCAKRERVATNYAYEQRARGQYSLGPISSDTRKSKNRRLLRAMSKSEKRIIKRSRQALQTTISRSMRKSLLNLYETHRQSCLPSRQANAASTREPSANRRCKRESRTRSGDERKKLENMLAPDRSLGGNRTATREEIRQLVDRILPTGEVPVGCTSWAEHRIIVDESQRPVKQRYYPVSKKLEEDMHSQVRELLAAGHIRRSSSEWSSPVVMVRKANGSYRQEWIPSRPGQDSSGYRNDRAEDAKTATPISWHGVLVSQFLENFATIADPLNRLLKKNTKYIWGEEQQAAFGRIKALIASAPMLSRPSFEHEFVVQTDASDSGLGAVLTQTIDGEEKVLCFASRTLNKAERNYSVTERECLAVLWAIQKFRPYVEGYRFRVITDHSSLRWLHNLRNPTGKLSRWSLELQQFDYIVEHRKGTNNVVPDALSRLYEDESDEAQVASIIINEKAEDSWYNKLLAKIPFIDDVVDDQDAWKLIVPREKRQQVLFECHEEPTSGHLGRHKTYERLAMRYYWPSAHRDVTKYVRECQICQQCKVQQLAPAAGLMGRRAITRPWSVVAGDTMGPFPRSAQGNEYIIIFMDLFTRWIEAVPVRKANARTIRKHLLERVFLRFGAPERLAAAAATTRARGQCLACFPRVSSSQQRAGYSSRRPSEMNMIHRCIKNMNHVNGQEHAVFLRANRYSHADKIFVNHERARIALIGSVFYNIWYNIINVHVARYGCRDQIRVVGAKFKLYRRSGYLGYAIASTLYTLAPDALAMRPALYVSWRVRDRSRSRTKTRYEETSSARGRAAAALLRYTRLCAHAA
ncbi:unnamed protein product [Trichogramma brassicae]|uniref:RNA-directed DNA polymerase n=1 Tax=Trichogramma brassicae TaxID=86971 RepID=A0A6H5HSX2_9HYME|nr:unnamed protein product [Trichogramma brassicae]